MPRKRGRPSKYGPDVAKQAYKLCLLGATDERLADFFEVSISTITNWKNEYPEFLAALNDGRDEADANVAQSLYRRATGYRARKVKVATHEGLVTDVREYEEDVGPDTTACIFWLKNRQYRTWRDRWEMKVETKEPAVLVAPAEVNMHAWAAQFAKDAEIIEEGDVPAAIEHDGGDDG